jgi:hypothetical protein
MREGSIDLTVSKHGHAYASETISGQDQQAETGGDDICLLPGQEGNEEDVEKGLGVCGDALCSA